MTRNVTLTINTQNDQQRKATVKVEDKQLIKTLFPNIKDKTISETEFKYLQETAAKNGDMGVLEAKDMSPNEKLRQAEMLGHTEYYDIKISDDNKYFLVTVKKTGMFHPDPTAHIIKEDFGLAENVLMNNNKNLVVKRTSHSTIKNGNVTDYDGAKFKAGDTIQIPVNDVVLKDSVNGFFGRLFDCYVY